MALREEIQTFLSEKLQIDQYRDASLNGLQIEGQREIGKVAVAVDLAQATVAQAIKAGAQMLITHHGVFWGQSLLVTGAHKQLLKTCLAAELNVFVCHLPLDGDEALGNNFALSRLLDCSQAERAFEYEGSLIGCVAENSKTTSFEDIVAKLATLPGADKNMLRLNFGPDVPKRIAFLSGSGADVLYQHEKYRFDTLITGEARQFAYHYAKEHQLNVIFAGHYATETLGVCETGKALAAKFGIEWEFLDHPTHI